MISRASAKVCQVLQDIESHLRTKEGRPIRAEVDKLSKIAMNAILDPRNDDCFDHSEAFEDLFHVYAADVITMKQVVDNLSTSNRVHAILEIWNNCCAAARELESDIF